MEVEWIQTFLRVADLGSLTLAAKRLPPGQPALSQPALSRHIRLLEEQVGAKLFERTGRGMRLTEQGSVLRRHAAPLLQQIIDLPKQVEEDCRVVRGQIRVAFPPSFGAQNISELIARYRKSYPQVRLQIAIALSGAVRRGLLGGSLDVGMVYSPVKSAEFETRQLYRESLWLVGPRSANFRPDRPVTLAQALREPLVLPSLDHDLRQFVEGTAKSRGAALDVVLEADSLEVLLSLAERNVGCCVLAYRSVETLLREKHICAAPIHRPKLEYDALLAWPRSSPASRARDAFVGLTLELLRS